jgi:predicted small metal-binding protein
MQAVGAKAARRLYPPLPRKGELVRKLDCQCGYTVEGENDEELFQKGKQHVAEVHPAENITDDQLRQLISTQAYDG